MVSSALFAYLIGGVVLVMIAAGVIFFWLKRKNKGKKFPFILHSLDGEKARMLGAIVKVDKQNSSKKVFYFPEFDDELPIKEPTWYFAGTAYREVTQDRNGELQYLDRHKIDKEKYLKVSIDPEEKALALYRYKENMRRYENPMDKASAAMLISGFVLVFLIMIGVIYSTISFANSAKSNVEFVKEQNKGIAQLKAVAESQERTTEQLVTVAALLTGNNTIIRKIG